MNITAVVVIRNEAPNLIRYFEHVKRFCNELIVIDQQSTDESLLLSMQYADKVIVSKNVGYNELDRGYGMTLAKNDWVCLLDPDEAYENEFIDNLPTLITIAKTYNYDGIITDSQTLFDGIPIKEFSGECCRLALKTVNTATRVHTSVALSNGFKVPYIHYHYKNSNDAIKKEMERQKYHDDERIKDNMTENYKKAIAEFLERKDVMKEAKDAMINKINEQDEIYVSVK